MAHHTIAALYQFHPFPQYREAKSPLLNFCGKHNILGTLLLASEGINGTVAGSPQAIENLKDYLQNQLGFEEMQYKLSYQRGGKPPFNKLKIKIKKEIVTMGIPGINPCEERGTYVTPEQWNTLIQDPEVLVIDTRNHYEYRIGTFKGAIDPHTLFFRQFPQWVKKKLNPDKHKKIAMFCTGGIRCEKATSLLKREGFQEVYHLEGGILKYLEEVKEDESLWEGECFVFDNRVSVNQNLQPGDHKICYGCGEPLTKSELASEHYREGISCPRCYERK